MTTVSLQEIQRDPLAYLNRVEAGETLLVVREDRAVAEIGPISFGTGAPRPFGLCAGEFAVPDDFDEPLSESLIRGFEAE